MADDIVVGGRISATNFARVIKALADRREELVGERGTDRELYMAWMEGIHTELVNKDERKTAMGTVSPDLNIVDIT